MKTARHHSGTGPAALWVVAASVLAGACAVALALIIAGQARDAETTAAPDPTESQAGPSESATASAPVPSATPTPSPSPAPPPDVVFTVVAAGDVLPHSPVDYSARQAGDGEPNFAALMTGVEPYIAGADLALCHLESPITPEGQSPSGYPRFAADPALVTGLAEVGWDGCSTASNHTVDRGFAGLETTLDTMEAAGLGQAGAARTEEESLVDQVYEVSTGDRTVTVAHVSYTYGLNGLPKPDGMPWSVNTFDADAADAGPIIEAAENARANGADIVIASTHCCVEYQTQPTAAQQAIVEQIGESGAVDLYVGHHAHVPQPIAKVPGGVNGDGMWAAYGLGNFLSNQSASCCSPNTSNGVLLSATFTVTPEGVVSVVPGWTATTVDRSSGHAVHVLTDITDGTATLSPGEVEDRHSRVADAVGADAAEVTSPVEALADAVVMVPRVAPAS